MKKDAYYFPHFSNARNDRKMLKLRRVMGIEGYGIYFMLLEVLRDQSDFRMPLDNLEDLAFEWHTSREKLTTIVANFDLFELDENDFFSTRFNEYMQPYLRMKEQRIEAAKKSVEARRVKKLNNRLTTVETTVETTVKQSKVKKSKVKDIIDIKELKEKALASSHSQSLKNSFLRFSNYLEKDCKHLSKINKQITIDQFKVLSEKYEKDLMAREIEKMELWLGDPNVKPAKKKKESLYHFVNTWLNNAY